MLFRNFGVAELLLILVLSLLIFGPGRIGKLGGEVGRAIRGFKDEVKPRDVAAEKSESGRAG